MYIRTQAVVDVLKKAKFNNDDKVKKRVLPSVGSPLRFKHPKHSLSESSASHVPVPAAVLSSSKRTPIYDNSNGNRYPDAVDQVQEIPPLLHTRKLKGLSARGDMEDGSRPIGKKALKKEIQKKKNPRMVENKNS
jgi:hypothetical protein